MHFSVLETNNGDSRKYYPMFLFESEEECYIPHIKARRSAPFSYKWYTFEKYSDNNITIEEIYFNSLEQAKEFINREKKKLPIIHFIKDI